MNTKIRLANLELKNPVLLASGTFDQTITKHIDVNQLGGIITKTVTLKPRQGNPLPHIIKTKYGWLNSVGWKNPGIKEYLEKIYPFWQRFHIPIITSIGGFSQDDYIILAKILQKENIPIIEVCLSCKNVTLEGGGSVFGRNAKTINYLVRKIRQKYSGTLIVKLAADVTDIVDLSKAALSAGADIISLTNTLAGMEIDNQKKAAKLVLKIGGYSGPAIKPIALQAIWKVYKELGCPIIGSGGISDFDDALDFIMVGSTAVAIGSANYQNPKISLKIVQGFQKYIRKQKFKNLNQIKGII